MKYLSLIDDVITDFLKDMKSLRVWLIIWAYVFNFIILYLVYAGKADYKLSGIGIALLTAVYTYMFASKHAQAQNEANQSEETKQD